MARPIRDYFKGRNYATVEEALSHAAIDPVTIENNDLELLLKSRLAKPQHICIFLLHRAYGHTQREIAEHFGVSNSAICSTVQRALQIVANLKRKA